jgi:hypothetical protein
MDFSTMILTMYLAADDSLAEDERVLQIAIDESVLAGELGFNPWYTEHHFRGPWHSNPIQFAAYVAPQLPDHLFFGFGVLSLPYYHPVRLVESTDRRPVTPVRSRAEALDCRRSQGAHSASALKSQCLAGSDIHHANGLHFR